MNEYTSYKIKLITTDDVKKYYNPKLINNFCSECPKHGKIWTCPPLPFKDIDYISGWKYCYIISGKIGIDKIPDEILNEYINNSMLKYTDISLSNSDNTKIFNGIYYAFREFMDEKLILLEKDFSESTSLISGRCLICRKCTREDNLPCIHPDKKRYSLESLGFDVAAIIENVLSDKIQWSSDSLPEYVTCVSALLTNDIISENQLYEKLCK